MTRGWDADARAAFVRRLGRSAEELGHTEQSDGCPDIWLLDSGDIAVIGRDRTDAYRAQLPEGVTVRHDERLVVIPGSMLSAAKPEIPDA